MQRPCKNYEQKIQLLNDNISYIIISIVLCCSLNSLPVDECLSLHLKRNICVKTKN